MEAIRFVSLGPGEPELITVKGLKTLQNAHCIFCPETRNKDGKKSSRAAVLLKELPLQTDRIRPFELPMSKERQEAFGAYDRVYEAATELQAQGKRVAIVAEGDAGFYSSIHYIYERLQDAGLPAECVAGVPAFIAAGAIAGLHVASQEERMVVIPGVVNRKELEEYLKQKTVVVIMKLSQCTEEVHACIDRHPEYQFHYFENVGTQKAYYSCNKEELKKKKYPYFSLMIIRY